MAIARALGRVGKIGGLIGALMPLQTVRAVRARDPNVIQRILFRGILNALNIHVKVTGSPIIQNQPAIFSANHQSYLDIAVIGSVASGSFIAKDELSHIPVFSSTLKSFKPIFVKRGQGGKDLPSVHAQEADILNSGRNIIVFPEGNTSSGAGLLPFKHGAISVVFENMSEVKLNKDVLVQPMVVRVTHVNGEEAVRKKSLRDVFAWYGKKPHTGRHIWRLLQNESVDIEVNVLPPLNPKDFAGDYKLFGATLEKNMRAAYLGAPQITTS